MLKKKKKGLQVIKGFDGSIKDGSWQLGGLFRSGTCPFRLFHSCCYLKIKQGLQSTPITNLTKADLTSAVLSNAHKHTS